MAKTKKNQVTQSRASDMRKTDTLILVMGQTGVGKSNFINVAANENVMSVSDSLHSCTKKVKHVVCPHPDDPARRIVLVDTPGLDDTYADDFYVVSRIVEWMRASCHERMKVSGIIYMSETNQRRLPLFKEMRANNTLRNATLSVSSKNESQGGVHFMNNHGSAWDIIDSLLRRDSTLDAFQIRTHLCGIAGLKPPSTKPESIGLWRRFISLFS